jgi:hypothetical protein
MKRYLFCFLLLSATLLGACKKDDDCDGDNQPANYRPIIMVHGFLASGDTYAGQAMRLSSNGYEKNKIYVFDWNSLNQGSNTNDLLDQLIDSVLAATGATQVDLVGHSAGGGVGFSYISDSTHAAKVAHYIHLGSNPQSGVPVYGGDTVKVLNIWSAADSVVAGANIPGATNVTLQGADHYQVATSEQTFTELFKFCNDGKMPTTVTITPQTPIQISGKCVTLGENAPMVGATIKVYPTDNATGLRVDPVPAAVLTVDSKGKWGPIDIMANQTYEFEVISANSTDRVVHYYREGFFRSNHLVYLRTLPPANSIAGFLLNGLPNTDDQSVVAFFASSQAVITGRDNFSVNNTNLAISPFADASKTAIAYFMYDDGDNTTEVTPVGLFGQFPFLNGVDMFFATTPPHTISLQFNGRTLNVPNLKSATDGVIVAVFD